MRKSYTQVSSKALNLSNQIKSSSRPLSRWALNYVYVKLIITNYSRRDCIYFSKIVAQIRWSFPRVYEPMRSANVSGQSMQQNVSWFECTLFSFLLIISTCSSDCRHRVCVKYSVITKWLCYRLQASSSKTYQNRNLCFFLQLPLYKR